MALIRIFIFTVVCSISLAALTPLDDFSKKTIDELVRKQLLFKILSAVNDTIKLQNQLKTQCERTFNSTIDQCKACAQAHNQQPSGNVLTVVLPVLLGPVLQTGEFLKGVEGSVVDAVSFLGDSSKKFVEDVGSVAKNAGESLLHGATDIVNDAVGGLKDFGDTLANLANSLGSGLDTISHEVLDGTLNLGSSIGSELTDLGNTLTSGANSAVHAVQDLGHQVEHIGSSIGHAVSDIGHSIGSIFGKRRRRSVCPSCDNLDTNTLTPEEIVKRVCGTAEYQQQHQLSTDLQKMKRIYDYAVKNVVIQKIEYNPASIDVSNGVAFRTVFVTYSFGTESRYQSGTPVEMTNLPNTAEGLTEEIYNRG